MVSQDVSDHLRIINDGLTNDLPRSRPKRVIVVGAGMAGLVAAHELLRAGHDPIILEAQSRVGGRVYDASAKIFLQFRRRFWEEEEGIHGGGSVTDLAVHNIFYPEHGRETGRGVLLASYTWAEDAQRWGSLSPADRIHQALENLAQIHEPTLREFECGASKMWHDDEFAGGAFALFDPGQQTQLHEHIVAPEGRIHFAGEHTSLAHAWIQGAIDSGLRAAQAVHLTNPGNDQPANMRI